MSFLLANYNIYYIIIGVFLYIIYYYKYSYYFFEQEKNYTQGKHRIGKTLPPYPNGWFIVLKSSELKIGESKYVDSHGESLAIFRGAKGEVYVLSAFCPHLGANLGVEGKVVYDNCIQCPFHGWTFEGETGICVAGKGKKAREGISYEYEKNSCGGFEFKEKSTELIKIKKFKSKEHSGYIYVWFSADKKEQVENFVPEYEPFDLTEFQKKLSHRAISLNKVNVHISDITENGSDILHFKYVHSEIIPFLIDGKWDARWIRADDPKLKEKVKHSNKIYDDYRINLLDKFLTEKNKKYIGVINLDCSISLLKFTSDYPFFSLTGFQVGPGIVYLFLKSQFFETMFVHYIITKEKFNQMLYHELWSNWSSPYWFSALQLRLEVTQVLNDGVVWDNKKFAFKAFFNKEKSDADDSLINWRKWYSQFYIGCAEEEEQKQKERLDL